jgi:hypothetical protein
MSTRNIDKTSNQSYQWDHYSGLPGTGAYK